MIKRFLFTLATLLAAMSLNAQDVDVKYQGEVDLGYSIGTGDFSSGRVNLHTIHGAKVGNYFFAGLGVGLDYFHEFNDDGELMLPIFLDMKGYYPVTEKISPFVSLDLGYGVGLTEGVSGLGGFMWSPAVGVKINRFQAQVGFTSQRFSESGIGFNAGAVQFKVGLVF